MTNRSVYVSNSEDSTTSSLNSTDGIEKYMIECSLNRRNVENLDDKINKLIKLIEFQQEQIKILEHNQQIILSKLSGCKSNISPKIPIEKPIPVRPKTTEIEKQGIKFYLKKSNK